MEELIPGLVTFLLFLVVIIAMVATGLRELFGSGKKEEEFDPDDWFDTRQKEREPEEVPRQERGPEREEREAEETTPVVGERSARSMLEELQGMTLEADEEEAFPETKPGRVRRKKRLRRVVARLADREDLLYGVIFSELLSKPVSSRSRTR